MLVLRNAVVLTAAVLWANAFAPSSGFAQQVLSEESEVKEDPQAPESPQPESFSGTTLAQEPQIEWEKRQNPDERLRSYGPDFLGDQIDPNSGSISFEHTDVSLPGNSGLEVALRRRISQGYSYGESTNAEFGDWEYAVPRIVVVAPIAGWTGNRCSSSFATTLPSIPAGSGPFKPLRAIHAHEYSQGVMLEVPGVGAQQIQEDPTGAYWPAGATHVTADGWYLTCTTASDGGEGFYATAPNGDRYKFDRYIKMTNSNLGSLAKGKGQGAPRSKALLAATEVTDVNGNWVHYTYDGSGRLTKIDANDGRRIDLIYSGSSALVSQVKSNPQTPSQTRTWNYSYRTTTYLGDWWNIPLPTARQVLSTVTQPDGKAWTFTLDAMSAGPGPDQCANDGKTVSLTHPYGVTGIFTLDERRHRQGLYAVMPQVPQCPDPEPSYGSAPPNYIHGMTDTMSVTSKTLSGPGIANSTWTFEYEADFGPTGAGGSDPTNWTIVTEPGGTQIKYYHQWQDDPNGGKLMKKEIRQSSGSSPIETSVFDYTRENTIGSTFARNAGPVSHVPFYRTLPTETTITRDGDIFWTEYAYNSNFSSPTYSFGFPIEVDEGGSTTSGLVRNTVTVYAHNTTKWVLGLPSTITRNGKLFNSFTYDTLGRMLTHSNFGVLRQTLTYNADGTIATAKDSHNHTYTLSNWKRGQAQTVLRPGGTTFSRTIDDNGWVTSETDPNGNVFGFSYNNVGWLTGVDRPSPFNDVTVSYSGLGTNAQEIRTQGAKKTTISYDGMLRPTLVKTEATDASAATVYEKTAYDIFGRTTFQSWPSASSSPVNGVETTYDALSRPLTVAENVTPYATTTTEYLSGGQTRITDPSSAQVTTTSRAFGNPANAEVMSVTDAMGGVTTTTRDIYGLVTQLSQTGSYNGFNVSVARQFWYDNNLRLCRHRAPEFGDEVFLYDTEGQLTESGRGQAAASGCVSSIGTGIRVTHAYDALHRETAIAFPAGTPGITRTYDNNGNVLTANRTGGAAWSYAYNALNLLTVEELSIDGKVYGFNYGYPAHGFVNRRTRASGGPVMMYDANAYGQLRSVRVASTTPGYISGAAYHPNGVLAGASFLNGQELTQSLNTRQQPYVLKTAKSGGAAAIWQTYAYDARRKISSVTDTVSHAENRSFTYDPNGRLLAATGPWGSGSFVYDALSNLRSQTLGARAITVAYDGTNRAASANDAGTPKAYSYDSRGNATTVGPNSFTYDFANQPVSVSSGVSSGVPSGANAIYAYDANFKRVKSVEDGKTTYYAYSKLSGGLIFKDEATDGKVTDYYNLGSAGLRLVNGTDATYTHADWLGSPVAATDAAGAVLWRESYNPFGEARLKTAANDNQPGFTGHIDDRATGLTYMQARYYDPVIGRFLSTDPIGYQDQLNLYAYCGNDPIGCVDPTGEASVAVERFIVRAAFAGGLSQADSPVPGPADVAAVAVLAVSAGALAYDSIFKNEEAKPEAHPPRAPTDEEKAKVKEAGEADSGKAGLSEQGRAAQKHGDRAGSAFPPAGSNTEDRNASGAATTAGIVDSEGTTIAVNDKGETIVRAPDGRGIKLNPDGSFNGYREPPRSNGD